MVSRTPRVFRETALTRGDAMMRTIGGVIPIKYSNSEKTASPWQPRPHTVRVHIDTLLTHLQFLRESVGETDVRIQQITNLLNDLKSEWRTKS